MEFLKITALVISLVGCVILVWKFIHYIRDRKEKRLKDMPVEDVSYNKVMNEYNEATPLQRKNFMSKYKGIKVKWHVEYYAITDTFKRGRVVMLMCFSEGRKYPYINFKTDLKKFPFIGGSCDGDKLIVTGLVDKVKGNMIYLKLIEVEKNKLFFF